MSEAPRPDDPDSAGFARQLARYGHLGIMFPVSIGVGAWLGYRLDLWLDSVPWFSIGGFLLGVAAAVRDLVRTLEPTDTTGNGG